MGSGRVRQAYQMQSKLNWNEEDWIDAFSLSTDKPRMEYCEDENGMIVHIRAVQGHRHGYNQSDFFP